MLTFNGFIILNPAGREKSNWMNELIISNDQ